MSRACTSGRPELIIVENWRVKITMSRILIDPNRFFFVAPPSSILTRLRRSVFSCARTSSRLLASIVADFSSPLIARAVYVNVAMDYPLSLPCHRGLARLLARPVFRRDADHAHELRLIVAGPQHLLQRDLLAHVQVVERIV